MTTKMCDQPEDINLPLARRILLYLVANADVNTLVRLWRLMINPSAVLSHYEDDEFDDTLAIHPADLMLPDVQAALSYLVHKGDK